MNPLSPDFSNRAASSPALYNRCVIDWFGDWSRDGLFQVAKKLTELVECRQENYSKDNLNPDEMYKCLVDSITSYHMIIKDLNDKLSKNAKKFNYITPRDFLDFIKHFTNLQKEKNEELNEQKKNLIKQYEINSKQIKIDNLIRDKLKDTINYINNNYKYFNIEEQLELKVIHPSLIRLKIIENVINDLSVEKQIFMTKFPIEYDKFLITSHLKEKLKNIENRKKKEIEKQQKLIEKIIYNNSKIHIVPSRKLDLSKLKK
jgi:hypothetical protein